MQAPKHAVTRGQTLKHNGEMWIALEDAWVAPAKNAQPLWKECCSSHLFRACSLSNEVTHQLRLLASPSSSSSSSSTLPASTKLKTFIQYVKPGSDKRYMMEVPLEHLIGLTYRSSHNLIM